MPRPKEYESEMVGLLNPYLLRGTYIGSVFTRRGVELYVMEKQDGQCFVGVKGSVAIIEKEAANAQQEETKTSPRKVYG